MKIGISSPMLAEIININDKFLEEKETKLGKKITEQSLKFNRKD